MEGDGGCWEVLSVIDKPSNCKVVMQFEVFDAIYESYIGLGHMKLAVTLKYQ